MFNRPTDRWLSPQGTAVVRGVLVIVACHAMAAAGPTAAAEPDSWLQFRGPGGRSAIQGRPPVEFGGETNLNIAWSTDTAGRGIGSPLVIGDLVVTTSSGGEDERDLYVEAFDRDSGDLMWRRTAYALGRPYTHPTSANASPTPASDGQRIFALYSSCDLLCYDLSGRLLWYRGLAVDHPKTGNDVSMSSSPVVAGGVVAVQLENQGDSFAAGLDAVTGETLWQIERPRRANWASPLPITLADDRQAFVLQCGDSIQVVQHRTGELLYRFDLGGSTIASPTFADQKLLVPAGGLTAIDFGLASPQIVYDSNRLRTRNASYVVFRDRIYSCNGSVLVAGTLADGSVLWQQRLPSINSVWATPVATESGIYVFDQEGAVAVVQDDYTVDDPQPQVIGTTTIEGPVLASPALAGNAIFVRSERALTKIADPATD